MDKGEIRLFQTQGGETKVEVRLADESVWLFGYTGADWDSKPEEAGTLMRVLC